jgi:periplasmic protein CpxP/Spy
MSNFAGKNMMRTAALLLCSVSLVLPALAQTGSPDGPPPSGQQGPPPGGGQGGGRRGGGPEQRLEMMTRELNLTADQQAKIKTILEDGRGKMMALRQDSSVSQDDRRTKMEELMKAESLNIKVVLDDTQKPKFEEMEKRQRERMRDGGGRGPGGPPPQGSAPPASPQA